MGNLLSANSTTRAVKGRTQHGVVVPCGSRSASAVKCKKSKFDNTSSERSHAASLPSVGKPTAPLRQWSSFVPCGSRSASAVKCKKANSTTRAVKGSRHGGCSIRWKRVSGLATRENDTYFVICEAFIALKMLILNTMRITYPHGHRSVNLGQDGLRALWALFLLAALHSSNEFDSALARSVG